MTEDIFPSPIFSDLASKDEAEIVEEIRLRVNEMLDQNPELLFSYLYRLDVLEIKIKAALKDSTIPTDQALATLIWERQKQRLETRKKYSTDL